MKDEVLAGIVIDALSTGGRECYFLEPYRVAGIHPKPGESVEIQMILKIYGESK